jgi:hypothetical protein
MEVIGLSLYTRERKLAQILIGNWVSSRVGVDVLKKRILLPLPEFESRIVQPVA